ncbi:unnamed protein product [Didymodactylos carnosus]|nr:unnamed protein product [Didymodactylos carnosus]CAF4468804.1 unnamed protein product [Didymodactylos carnosus]
MIVFGNRRPPTDYHFIGRATTNSNVMEFVLRWGAVPKDLDSHMYASNGAHVFYQMKTASKMSLDCDVTSGNGPETIKVILEPSVKYVYAVHRYSKDGELTKSNATLLINSNQLQPVSTASVPRENRPQANFWIVCVIDGTTKNITYINKFEEHNNYSTNEVGVKYFNA